MSNFVLNLLCFSFILHLSASPQGHNHYLQSSTRFTPISFPLFIVAKEKFGFALAKKVSLTSTQRQNISFVNNNLNENLMTGKVCAIRAREEVKLLSFHHRHGREYFVLWRSADVSKLNSNGNLENSGPLVG